MAHNSSRKLDWEEDLLREHARRRKMSLVVFVVVALVVISIAVGIIIYSMSIPVNTDPRKGEVDVSYNVVKYCDGTTLIYESSGRGRSISAIPNSNECS